MSLTRVVAITGCDSGLGWALAARMARANVVTVAGLCSGTETPAAKSLKRLAVHPCELNVTSAESVQNFRNYVNRLLSDNPNYRLHAIVNNAGLMTIGDYEWQTEEIIDETIDVNLKGTMRVISKFLPDLRKSAIQGVTWPRIITVASHCGLQPLPGFAPYSASKAALLALTTALRMEHRPYGVRAVAFVPGGFVGASNLLARQTSSFNTMLDHLDDEQRAVYESRITDIRQYLEGAAAGSSYDSLHDERIIETFMKALMDDNPKELYKVESWRYKLYYSLFRLPMPEFLHYWLIKRFISFPNTDV